MGLDVACVLGGWGVRVDNDINIKKLAGHLSVFSQVCRPKLSF